MKQKKPLGESLVKEGIITAEQFKQAKAEGERLGLRLRKVLVKMGFISEEDLVEFLSGKLGLPRIELNNYLILPEIIELVPEDLARKHELVPVLKIGNRLTCAMVDPWNVFALDEVRSRTNLVINLGVATASEIKKSLDEYYGVKGSVEEVIKSIDEAKFSIKGEEGNLKKLEGIVEEPVIIRLVNLIIMKAIHKGASDIHIEPEERTVKIRFRIDGLLYDESPLPKHFQSVVVSRIKIMAKLLIDEKRIPQDGRFTIKVEGKEIDVRVSCMPTIYGENVVLRLLDVSTALMPLNQLGFSKQVLEKYQKFISRPYGMILLTGPTGSGKTTTLYSSLNTINTVQGNIVTIEDPVEYKLSGINQTQVNPKVNLTFANGLRSMLRQDPDVVMVGEIRDFETAEIAVQASLTGHLVFSTLHTNDAPGAIIRMFDIGVEPYLVSSSVICVLAQRLVRKICLECKEKYEPSKKVLENFGLRKKGKIYFYRGKGCPECMNTGYKGRIGILELMVIDEKIRNLIVEKVSAEEIRKQACSSGMLTLREDGIQKIKDGITTVEEVLNATQEK